jgi:hypothetical protein
LADDPEAVTRDLRAALTESAVAGASRGAA